jgi:predicted metalloprotease with PDZ domain
MRERKNMAALLARLGRLGCLGFLIWLICLACLASVLMPACAPRKDREAKQEIRVTALPPAEVRVDDPDLIQYTLRFGPRQNHYIEVEALFPAGADSLELSMAVWTPGSYLVREFSRHIEAMTAATVAGEPLPITKTAKNRWRVDAEGADRIVVRYRLYCRELSVRTNYVTSEIAVLNGAPTFLNIADGKQRPFDVALELPEDWKESVTALDPHPQGRHRFLAPDYDTLVDSPIVAGNPALYHFDIEGIPHTLANFGEDTVWDGPRSARDVETLARAHVAMWRFIPYRRYVFLNVLTDGTGGGGLEHKESTLMLASRWMTRKREDYQRWLGLVSHEFFHTWNVKRMRPRALGPFDYESENYTSSLWIAEGLTSYYDDLLLIRAGLISEKEYLKMLSGQIEAVQTTPGRALQSLSDSSFDTWIKFYRPNENSLNTQMNYYTKGAVVGFLLDAEIRHASRNQRSLDDLMRLAYERFAGDQGYTPEEFQALAAEVAGGPVDELFARAVNGTEELDYQQALELHGLRFGKDDKSKDGAAKEDRTGKNEDKDEEPAGYLGAELGSSGEIKQVRRDSPAFAAGLNVDDELIALDDYRIKGANLDERLERYRPGDRVSVLVTRLGQMRRIEVTLGKKPEEAWKLEPDPRAGQTVKSRRALWLSGAPAR